MHFKSKAPFPTISPYNVFVTEEFLRTKLSIPPLRLNLAPGPRLVEQMNEELHRKLTLIVQLMDL